MDLFFLLSKTIWVIIDPGNFILILFIIGVILLWRNKQVLGRRILTFLAVLMLFIGFFPVGSWLIYPLEERYEIPASLPEKVDGIIVLSGAIDINLSNYRNQAQVNELIERDLAFVQLAHRYPDARLIYTGGTGSIVNSQSRGADGGRLFLSQQAINLERILFERNSRNTAESAEYSYTLAQPKPDETWLLITTSWHMPRSMGVFCKAGWNVTPFPVDFRTSDRILYDIKLDFSDHLDTLVIGTKEWVGLIGYWLGDKTPALFPGSCAANN
jgi:uncharacterized SAM-binding protein YcdF (DUF218 family)